ncbi:MAG: pyruvate dehydrogenase, partial [Gammaproteobacteria bacterium]|nr:pyruvate dehydrogenase [Gammaproteobacteria bacterium]
VFYYITVMNENYTHPAMPEGVEEGIIKGLYLFQKTKLKNKLQVQLMGSGTIFREVIKAAEILEKEFKVSSTVWSATSFNELRRDIEHVERHNRLQPKKPKVPYVTECLAKHAGPVIAATDYIKLYADQIHTAVPTAYYALGTNGFGRSDTREALREFFEVDAKMIAYTALTALVEQGDLPATILPAAIKKLGIKTDRPDPVTV